MLAKSHYFVGFIEKRESHVNTAGLHEVTRARCGEAKQTKIHVLHTVK